MKCILVLCVLIGLIRSDILPDYISQLMCHRSDPKFAKCIKESFEKGRSFLKKGVPELNVPILDPLQIPLVTVDRTFNDLFGINGTIKNVEALGSANVIIERVKINPVALTGELRVYFPFIQIDMDYDVAGHLGFIKGNVKPVKKSNGVIHFALDKLFLKLSIGDGHIKLTADDPDLQFEADTISNFFNEDPGSLLKSANPVITETVTDVAKQAFAIVFDTIPAKELLPE